MSFFHSNLFYLGLAFEHSGWQSEQSWTFAEIFSDAIRHGLPAIQTQHPGLYYQQVKIILNGQQSHLTKEDQKPIDTVQIQFGAYQKWKS